MTSDNKDIIITGEMVDDFNISQAQMCGHYISDDKRRLLNISGIRGDKKELTGGKKNLSESDGDDPQNLMKDAAALCQFVYYCDPNRSGSDLPYHTASQKWIPFKPKQNSPFSKVCESSLNKFQETLKAHPIWPKLEPLMEIENVFANRWIGFFSMLFIKIKGNDHCDLAYVTAGTTGSLIARCGWDVIMDNLFTNFLQGVTGLSPQYTRSVTNARKIKRFVDGQGNGVVDNLYFFGHSLGGGMAIANSLATGCKCIVFNHAGLNVTRKIYGLIKNNYDKVTSYHTSGDFLSTESWNGLPIVNPILSILCSSANDGTRIQLDKTSPIFWDKNKRDGHDLVKYILGKYCSGTIYNESDKYL